MYNLFSQLKFFRKVVGGKWYYVRFKVHYGMHAIFMWVRKPMPDDYVLNSEVY